jgi:hypothetical protein
MLWPTHDVITTTPTLKADFQSLHEAPRSLLRVHAWALSTNHDAKQLILIRCKHSQRVARSFVRGLEIRLKPTSISYATTRLQESHRINTQLSCKYPIDHTHLENRWQMHHPFIFQSILNVCRVCSVNQGLNNRSFLEYSLLCSLYCDCSVECVRAMSHSLMSGCMPLNGCGDMR